MWAWGIGLSQRITEGNNRWTENEVVWGKYGTLLKVGLGEGGKGGQLIPHLDQNGKKVGG